MATPQRVAIYAWVSSAENTGTRDSQAERLAAYCAARGYHVAQVAKEVGSGSSDARPKLLALLADRSIGLFAAYVAHFEQLPSGTSITIPLAPHWKMTLMKHGP